MKEKKRIDFDWFKHEFNPNPAGHPECLECNLSECLDDPDAVNNCPIWASLEDVPSVIEIDCSVCGTQITEYLDTGEREIREADDEDG